MFLLLFLAIALGAGALASILWTPWLFPVAFLGVFVLLILLALAFLIIACNRVDKTKPQEGNSKFYRAISKHYIKNLMLLARLKVHTQGLEKLPKDGRFLMVCNHLHELDPAMLLHVFPDSQLAFIAKQEITNYFLIGSLLHKLQCQLINRENDKEALRTILKCIQIVKEDQASVAVFPEGYCSVSGKLYHFRSGVFKIAQKANVPVVVCTIRGTKDVLPRLKKLRASRVDVHLVDVIPAEQVKALSTVDLAELVYEKMIGDLGEHLRTDEKAVHPSLQRQQLAQENP